ncbi:30S ribosome-binding factor RbfA [Tissierella pigra]|uniref:Ribosome-binding factor A n=1 Tax=Tissierella pigra TaxID=2607614 RepID=A0A6N7XD81_9FIRM|nr:30S ribosome-binding factor RbfA [Tissierella pigra]MBU5426574.1 30S ribosome-binding factor RbfA [Tissierella pigra]MST99980.1 30S ribosome-binding factor RbfA [Tissierella pigra]
MNEKRVSRISEEVKKVVSELIYNGLKDPRVNSLTTVTKVEVTRDLRYAKIYISVFGNKEEKENTIKGLESAKGFIRKEISGKIDLRYTPEPIFVLDESIEHGIYMSKLIDDVNKDSKNSGDNSDEK